MPDVALEREMVLRVNELDKRVEQRFQDNAKAVEIAMRGLEVRLTAMNEFRGALTDQTKTFITRHELEVVSARIASLEEYKHTGQGKSQQTTVIMGIIFVLVGFGLRFIP